MTQDVDARLRALEAKVQDLSDREAIRSLRFRYHECINSETLDAIPDLFTEDATLDFDYLGQATGRAQLIQFFARVENLLSFVKQFVHNHAVDLEGDTITVHALTAEAARGVSDGEMDRRVSRLEGRG